MPRKKTVVEILPPEPPKRGRKNLVEAKHTITYNEPMPVEVEDDSDDSPDVEIENIEIEDKPRKRAKSVREELRKKLVQNRVTPESGLSLTIDKYQHSESTLRGVQADVSHCTRYPCTETHILNEDYLEIARKWGAGLFRFTLRTTKPPSIVDAWDKRIEPSPTTPVIQNPIPGDPASPQIIFQAPEGGQAAPFDPTQYMKGQSLAFKQQLENYKLMRDVFGPVVESQQGAAKSEDDVLAGAILKQPEVIETVVGSVLKRFNGHGGSNDDPSPWAVAMKLVESGQAAQIVKTFVDAAFNGFRGLFPGVQNNGTQTLAQAPLAQDTRPENPAQQNGQTDQHGQMLPAQTQPQSVASIAEAGAHASPQQQPMMPVDELVFGLIGAMERQAPVEEARTIIRLAIVRNPELGDSVDEILNLTTDQILQMLAMYYPQVSQMEHAREWIDALIASFPVGQDGGEDA